MKKNRTHKKPKFIKSTYKVAGADIITPDEVQNSASIAKARLLANKALQQNVADATDMVNLQDNANTSLGNDNTSINDNVSVNDKADNAQADTWTDKMSDGANLSVLPNDSTFVMPNQTNELVTSHSTPQFFGATTMTTNNSTKPNPDQTQNPPQDEYKAENSNKADTVNNDVKTNDVAQNAQNQNSSQTPQTVANSTLPKPFPKTQKSNNTKWLIACIIAVLAGVGLGQCMGKKSLISNTQTTTQTVASDGSTTTTTTTSKNVDLGAIKVTANTAVATELTPTDRVPVMAVEAITPKVFVMNESLTAEGAIFGGETASVGAKLNGLMVEQVFVKVGDKVKKGQTLAVLDDYTAKNEVLALTADKKQAEINLAKVNADFERIQGLMDIDAISWQQYDQYKAVKLQAQAQLDGINARLNSIDNQVKNTKVVAPVSGVISDKNAEVGMVTGGGSLFTIVKNDQLEWRASIQADKRDKVSIGQKVVLKNGKTGKVVRISPTANDKRELTVFVALNGAGVPIGSYQTGEFVLAQKSVLSLPSRVVMSYDGKEFVWVLTDKQAPKADDKTSLGIYTAKKLPLTNAKRIGDKVAVELPKDALIIKSGGNFLSEGDLVTLTAIDKQGDETANTLTENGVAENLNNANDNSSDNSSDDKQSGE